MGNNNKKIKGMTEEELQDFNERSEKANKLEEDKEDKLLIEKEGKKIEIDDITGEEIDVEIEDGIEKEENSDNVTIHLKEKIAINGIQTNKLYLDFESMTGTFLANCKKRYKKLGTVKKEMLNIESMDDKYHVIIVSELTGVKYSEIMGLKVKDFKKIVDETRNFLND